MEKFICSRQSMKFKLTLRIPPVEWNWLVSLSNWLRDFFWNSFLMCKLYITHVSASQHIRKLWLQRGVHSSLYKLDMWKSSMYKEFNQMQNIALFVFLFVSVDILTYWLIVTLSHYMPVFLSYRNQSIDLHSNSTE